MTLIEYIKKSYLRPNRAVLESLGASDELITYLLKTPHNTNISVVTASLVSGGGGEAGVEPVVGSAIVGKAILGGEGE